MEWNLLMILFCMMNNRLNFEAVTDPQHYFFNAQKWKIKLTST